MAGIIEKPGLMYDPDDLKSDTFLNAVGWVQRVEGYRAHKEGESPHHFYYLTTIGAEGWINLNVSFYEFQLDLIEYLLLDELFPHEHRSLRNAARNDFKVWYR